MRLQKELSFTLWVCLLVLIWPTALLSESSPPVIQIERIEKEFRMRVKASIRQSADVIHTALIDYPNLKRISPAITSSREIEPDLVEIVMHGCFAIFCFDKTQTQRITQTQLSVHGEIVPELSDYKSGWSHWQLKPTATGTQVKLETRFVPDFWIPPLIGNYLIKRAMKRQVERSIEAIEQLGSDEMTNQSATNN